MQSAKVREEFPWDRESSFLEPGDSRIKCGLAYRCISCKFCDGFSTVGDGPFVAEVEFSAVGDGIFVGEVGFSAVGDGFFAGEVEFSAVGDGFFAAGDGFPGVGDVILVFGDDFFAAGDGVSVVGDVFFEGNLFGAACAFLVDDFFFGLGVGWFFFILSFFEALRYCTFTIEAFAVLLESFRNILSPEEIAFPETCPRW